MDKIEKRLILAKQDKGEMSYLLEDYMPLIKREVSKSEFSKLAFDDRVSIGMLVFFKLCTTI